MLFALSVPADNERGPLYMDQALAAIHQSNHGGQPLQLSMGRLGEQVTLFLCLPQELSRNVQEHLYAQYPHCEITGLPDEALSPPAGMRTWAAALRLFPHLFPIKRYSQFEDTLNRTTADPLAALLAALRHDDSDQLQAHIELTVWPAGQEWRRRAQKCLHRLDRPFFRKHPRLAHAYAALALSPARGARLLGRLLARSAGRQDTPRHGEILSTSTSRLHEREQDLQAASDKVERLLFEVQIRLLVHGPAPAAAQAQRKLREVAGAFGAFAGRHAAFHFTTRRTPPRFLLSTEELATLWHLRTCAVQTPALAAVGSKRYEPPVDLPLVEAVSPGSAALTLLGETLYRSERQRFGIPLEDRRQHLALLGKTGMGKSTLLFRLIHSDIAAGRGVCVIDPHGDLIEALLLAVPSQRTNDVVLFDAADSAHPLGFNLLDCPEPSQAPLIVSDVVSAFRKLHGDSWVPRTEYILRNALAALIEVPGASLVSVQRLLGDEHYREAVAAQVRDPFVRDYWLREFAAKPKHWQEEATAAIQNKVGQFVASPLLRHIIGQGRNRLRLRQVMDEGKVLLVNLSKGRIGDDASALLGSFLVTAVQLAAMSRAAIREAERRDFFLYVDEFQNYATQSFATILSEARKYRLALTVANQYLAQLDEGTRQALFGNVGTLVSFQVGVQDAALIAEQLGGELTKADLLQLPRYQAYVRMLLRGSPRPPFSMRTLPPEGASPDPGRAAVVRDVSRRSYTRALREVEEELRQTLALG